MRSLVKNVYLKLFSAESAEAAFWRYRGRSLRAQDPIRRSVYRLLCERIQRRFGAYIPLTVEFASRPVFAHQLSGIFISGGAKIGHSCVIFHQVTIGSNTLSGSKRKGSPTIGNNVYIGCGAKIIGGVRIGDNVRIGANCVVTKDVAANSTVVLPEPRIILRNHARENGFVQLSEADVDTPVGQ